MPNAMYLRKSRTDLEAEARGEGETLARHRAALNDLARRLGLTVDAVYSEIVSGETIAERPEMQRLLADVQAGKWDGVLVYEVERLARGDSIDQGIVSQTFTYAGTKIYTPAKTYDPTNEFDEEYFEFGLFMSRREYKTIRRRMIAGRIASVKEGKYMGKNDPFGYRRVKLNEKGWSLEIVPEQAEIVRRIYGWCIDGVGCQTIARRLTAMGVKTRVGADWSPASVIQCIQNPLYCGYVTWGRKTSKKLVQGSSVTRKRVVKDEGDYIKAKGLHEALVSEETWDAAQAALHSRPAIKVRSDRKMRNPYQGLIYCAKCGHRLQMGTSHRGGHTTYSLFCPWHACDNVSSRMYAIDDAMVAALQQWIAGYETDVAAAESQSDERKEIAATLDALDKEAKKVADQLTRAFEFVETGVYTPEQFADRHRVLAARQAEIKGQMQAAQKSLRQMQARIDLRGEIIPRMEQCIEAFRTPTTVQERHDLLCSVISRITYQKDAPAYRNSDESNIILQIFPALPNP